VRNSGYFIYILSSRSRVLYVGVTSNLEQRVWQHKNHAIRGFTAQYNVDRLVHFEECNDIGEAIAREKQIKGWRRNKKVELIESTNPNWMDLSEDWY